MVQNMITGHLWLKGELWINLFYAPFDYKDELIQVA